MLVPNVKIKIDNVNINAVNEVSIKRSIYELAATATIKVPVSAVLKHKGTPPARIETAQQIKIGQKVEIQLGYNGQYNVEFRGYVKSLNRKSPLEIVCEDEFYNTRRTAPVKMAGKTTVKDILTKCGLKIAYAVDMEIADFPVDDKSVPWILSKLKNEFNLTVFFDMDGSVYASEPYKIICESSSYSPKNDQAGGTSEQPSGIVESPVKYRLRENVIKDDDLKYQHEGIKYKIKAVCTLPDGTETEATVGDEDSTEKVIKFYDVENEASLKILADNELRKYNNEIYDGKIETFLVPFAIPCMVAAIEDPKYSERNGNYYIESVDVKLGTGGGRRTIEIGIKL